jgi:MOSC domain-containing protein YiiM
MAYRVPNEPDHPEVDLYAPFTSDTILEVRTGTMKPLRGLTVQSGIDKTVRHGPVRVTELGLEGDEHDPTFHGGLDKAIHGCKFHSPGIINQPIRNPRHVTDSRFTSRLLLPLLDLAR